MENNKETEVPAFRYVEMIVAIDNNDPIHTGGTWYQRAILIPDNTPLDKVEEVAREKAYAELYDSNIVGIMLYDACEYGEEE